jgi:hypothetical protein
MEARCVLRADGGDVLRIENYNVWSQGKIDARVRSRSSEQSRQAARLDGWCERMFKAGNNMHQLQSFHYHIARRATGVSCAAAPWPLLAPLGHHKRAH